ncbi:MAG: ABC transporter ATP-binding protein [Gammaproteobacteria bacterium]|nr:ABC transporter ATP-binding protein [Gammaproteobacteria bacterium]
MAGLSTSARLEAINLSKRYEDGLLALDSVSFDVSPGSIYAMLGGNGAGKTTTINLFLNFIEPTEGEARIDGIVAHKEPLLAKQKIAYVSENVMLYPNFTALQNLDFFAKLGGRNDYSKADYAAVLSRVGLQEAAHNKRLKGYSKGMRQKCGIAIAILKDAPAILLDEPTAGLDPSAGMEFITLLSELRGEGKAILMSTHDIFRAKEVADTIGIMNEGRLVMERTAEQLQGENLERLYVDYMAGHVGSTQNAETVN